MILIPLNGGLGNQMFQYACGKALALKHKTPLVLSFSLLNQNANGTTKRSLELEVFRVKINEAGVEDLKRLKPILYRAVNVLAFKLGFKGIQMSKYFIENKFSYNSNIKKRRERLFFVWVLAESKIF